MKYLLELLVLSMLLGCASSCVHDVECKEINIADFNAWITAQWQGRLSDMRSLYVRAFRHCRTTEPIFLAFAVRRTATADVCELHCEVFGPNNGCPEYLALENPVDIVLDRFHLPCVINEGGMAIEASLTTNHLGKVYRYVRFGYKEATAEVFIE